MQKSTYLFLFPDVGFFLFDFLLRSACKFSVLFDLGL